LKSVQFVLSMNVMNSAVQFYQLKSTPLERALPKLVEKAYLAGCRVQLVLGSEERTQYVNDVLWTYSQSMFLPHGSAKDGNAERQPVYLSAQLETPPNKADVLFVTDGSTPPEGAYARVLDMFDGNDEAALKAARGRWKAYKDQGCELSYYKQNEAGAWESVSAAA